MIEIQQAQFWQGIIVLVFSALAWTAGAVWILSSALNKQREDSDFKIASTRKDLDLKLMDKVRERNEKIDGVGRSIDKLREEVKKDFVLDKVCCQMHSETEKNILRIENENKASRHETNDKLGKLFLLNENLVKMITDLQIQVAALKK